MRFIIILLFLFSTQSISKEYIIDSSSDVKSKEIIIDEGFKYTVVEIENRWTDSFGEYGTGNCFGHILTRGEIITLNLFCEQMDSKGDKFWTNLKRESEMDAGIGKITYLKGTGKYKKFENLKCTYAVRYMNRKTNFLRQKCKINF